MLNFCARHSMGAEVEVIGAEDVGVAYERLKTGDVRFRFALDIRTIAQDRQSSRAA